MFTVRQTEDRAAVELLHKKLFPNDQFDGEFFWLVWESGKDYPVGFATARKSKQKGWGFLARAGVLKEARGNNLQVRLIRARVKWAKSLGLKGVLTYAANRNSASICNLLKAKFKIYDPEELKKRKWGPSTRDGFVYFHKTFKQS